MTTIHEPGVEDWLESVARCFTEFSETMLDCDDVDAEGVSDLDDPNERGDRLVLLSVTDTTHLALASDADGWRRLSGMLLGMGSAEFETLSLSDVTDSMGEILNIVAGMIKRDLTLGTPERNLGLPEVRKGAIVPSASRRVAAVDLFIGAVDIRAFVVIDR